MIMILPPIDLHQQYGRLFEDTMIGKLSWTFQNGVDQARKTRIKILAPQCQEPPAAQGLVPDDASFSQHLHEMRLRRFGHRGIGEMALRHLKRPFGKLADDRQALRITQRKQHLSQLQRIALWMGKVGVILWHCSNLLEPLRKW
ncbi:hypothetical protein [Neorhizobium turbinariae]|uniref:hypothetical protein n=1 Tax=Neorhizobium turbinariae TaxID=2937795 RepID=UPI0028BF1DF1|nr:hypothetical protein [Neorhizobium turbinariae]